MLDKRLADDIIRWVHNQKAGAPDKPFLVYFAPGSTHAPHQAPPEYIARFKGKFDHGLGQGARGDLASPACHRHHSAGHAS